MKNVLLIRPRPRGLAGIAPTPSGRQILLNFLKHFT